MFPLCVWAYIVLGLEVGPCLHERLGGLGVLALCGHNEGGAPVLHDRVHTGGTGETTCGENPGTGDGWRVATWDICGWCVGECVLVHRCGRACTVYVYVCLVLRIHMWCMCTLCGKVEGYVCMCMYVHMYVYVYVHVETCICMCMCMCMCMCVFMYVWLWVYVYALRMCTYVRA